MNTAQMGYSGGALAPGGQALGPGINATYGNTLAPGFQQGVPGQMPGMTGMGISYQSGDFGNVLRVMNAERMQAEGELRDEEDIAMKELSHQQVGWLVLCPKALTS